VTLVSAALVTRGDHDLTEILESLPVEWPIELWDNSVERDLGVWGRYQAAQRPARGLVYVQDDDCVLEPESIAALVEAWRPGVLVANMPERFRHDFYSGHCLVGFGAVFEPQLVSDAFARFWLGCSGREPVRPEEFRRTCDIAFTGLVPERVLLDVPYRDLPWATDDSRMYRQPTHVGERKRMLELVHAIAEASL
jgi:hypothetical protein